MAAVKSNDKQSREMLRLLDALRAARSARAGQVEQLVALRRLVEYGGLRSLEPMLPLALSLNNKPYGLRDHYPFAPVFLIDMPSRLLIKSGRQVSKTGRPLTNAVYDAWGRRRLLGDVRVGDVVLSVDPNTFKTTQSVVTALHAAPSKPCLRITTRQGNVLEFAESHPFLSVTGWRQAGELAVGDRIAHVTVGGQFGDNHVADERVRLTAYMLGDGSLCGNYSFTAARTTAAAAEVATLGGEHIRRYQKRNSVADTFVFRKTHPIYGWAREDAAHDKRAHEKRIPAWVYKLSRAQTITFIERLWATDGMVRHDDTKPQIAYASTSRELVFDLKSLLLKFGIPTTVKRRQAGYRKDGVFVRCRDAFILRVETRAGWLTFLRTFNVPDKPGFPLRDVAECNNRDTLPYDVRELVADIVGECRGTSRAAPARVGLRRLPKYSLTRQKVAEYLEFFEQFRADHPRLPELRRLADCDLAWDKIVAIEPLGEQPCCDIEVANTHNYVVDGTVSHNSTSMAAHGVMLANSIPNLKTLYVTPLYEQIRRFSNNYVRPFIDQSPIKSLWTGTTTENSVLQRSFKNNSLMIFSFALLDADRCRGISSDSITFDEVQDMDPDHFPIIIESMSHSQWKLQRYTGTPKSLDNPIEGLWQRSSQAEWFIRCRTPGCHAWNIPALEYHIDKMMGPWRPDISEEAPAIVCHKCQRPLHPRPIAQGGDGRWVHRWQERVRHFDGYHVPQIIMPLHCCRPKHWAELLDKRETVAPNVFYNEVLGESVDVGQKIITETELREACRLPYTNDPRNPDPRLEEMLQHYQMTALAVDWGGGGEDGVSFTTLALIGITPAHQLHVLWGRRLLTPNDHMLEATQIVYYLRRFNVSILIHDYTGAGIGRETWIVQNGFPLERVMPIQYVRAASRNLIKFVPATPLHDRDYYRLDKTRSLLYTCMAIKTGVLQFFQWDKIDQDKPGLISDFLALVEEKTESRLAGDIYTITRNPMLTDDFAQAVNIGCAGLWHANQCWPNFAAAAAKAKIRGSQLSAAGTGAHGWETDPSVQDYFS